MKAIAHKFCSPLEFLLMAIGGATIAGLIGGVTTGVIAFAFVYSARILVHWND